MSRKIKITLAYLIVLVLINACGNKGDLFLPNGQKSNLEPAPTTNL